MGDPREAGRNTGVTRRGFLASVLAAGAAGCAPAAVRVPPGETSISTVQPGQIPSQGERVAIRLKPEELFRALLTTPLQPNELPSGFTAKGKSAGNLDATAQALKAIGQVNVLVVEPDPRFLGMPSGAISYIVFPDAARGRDAYNIVANRSDSRTLTDFAYPAAFLIESSLTKTNICVVLVDNTYVAAVLTSSDQSPQQERTVQLAQAGVKHLQRVGR